MTLKLSEAEARKLFGDKAASPRKRKPKPSTPPPHTEEGHILLGTHEFAIQGRLGRCIDCGIWCNAAVLRGEDRAMLEWGWT